MKNKLKYARIDIITYIRICIYVLKLCIYVIYIYVYIYIYIQKLKSQKRDV